MNALRGELIIPADTAEEVSRKTHHVSAAGPDWPDLEGVDLETLALADAFSNVEDGVGFLGAVWSKTAVLLQTGDI